MKNGEIGIKGNQNMTETTAEFVVYIINAIANKKDLYPSYVYKKIQETDCIQNYLVSFYDVLHTMYNEPIKPHNKRRRIKV